MTGPVLLTLGHGYSAQAFAASLPASWVKIGTTRSRDKAAGLRAQGITPLDWSDKDGVDDAIASASHILTSLAPDATGDPVLLRHGAAIRNASPRWIGYLSTTGVYGDRQGGWVDEESELAPLNPRGQWRVLAERAWLDLGQPTRVFRLAGIYGPGRSAFDRLRNGTAQRIVKPGQVFSRIHVEDIARCLSASLDQPGEIFNLADNEPAPPQDVIAYAADLLGLPCPPEIPFEAAELSPMARGFYAESKRVSNRRLREELGVTLLYPDYRSGLRAILKAE